MKRYIPNIDDIALINEVAELAADCLARNGTFMLTDKGKNIAIEVHVSKSVDNVERDLYKLDVMLFNGSPLKLFAPAVHLVDFKSKQDSVFGPLYSTKVPAETVKVKLAGLITSSMEVAESLLTDFELISISSKRSAMDIEQYKFELESTKGGN
jgi:hypothetical protein